MSADEHSGCRIQQFARWNRVMLEHERQHLSRVMAYRTGFLNEEARVGILHDLADIDNCLLQFETRIKL
jgi:hypothetical protein